LISSARHAAYETSACRDALSKDTRLTVHDGGVGGDAIRLFHGDTFAGVWQRGYFSGYFYLGKSGHCYFAPTQAAVYIDHAG